MSLLQLQNINFKLPNSNKKLFADFSLTVNPGDFIILLGNNGSGKSSLLKIISGKYPISTGKIKFLNQPITNYKFNKLYKHMSIMTQNCADVLFGSLTILENYLLVNKIHYFLKPAEKTTEHLAAYLENFNTNLSEKLSIPVDRLSGGEKQALALAFSLLKSPKLLLLDEHTSALDPKISASLMQLTQEHIMRQQTTCILVTHDLDIALSYGNRILLLHEGKIHLDINAEEKKSLTKTKLLAVYSTLNASMGSNFAA